ncbi:ABC transporter ATP-binding protein [Arthrobacter sp. JZ12]|uniref:ABC transporter ATP-binding protein n=1 Tax=Arthrobacter sp. JZ12 TaxID=2654190 RepID=UPI002B47693E|nr:ABC transporter ATP-binding protein [Arthrobacter sp. JZ12]WRH23893.1 ABC transporter ATP-binding protein [Arthrobacter sp. JZ12]
MGSARVGLPRLFDGDRGRVLVLLVAAGLGLACLAGGTAVLMTVLLGGDVHPVGVALAGGGLVAAAAGVGFLRSAERVLAERLGQSYIQQIRLGLLDSALASDRPPAPGITIARATNDLTSVRNWIALGIAPMMSGIPLILGSVCALMVLHPVLGAAAAVPLLLLTGALMLMARTAFARARVVRRKRGRLASLLADTIAAAPSVRVAGGRRREVRRIEKAGSAVVDASVHRAEVAGWIRGAAAAAGALTVAAVGLVGLWQQLPAATVAGALTIVGLLATPVADMGRAVEYRQNFRAARRILAPALAETGTTAAGAVRRQPPVSAPPKGTGVVSIASGSGDDVVVGLPLTARPGEVVEVRSTDPARVDALFSRIVGLSDPGALQVFVDGVELGSASFRAQRERVGYAVAGMALERGTIERAVRYRRPDLDPAEGEHALAQAGLGAAIGSLPKAERTELRRGGEPLSVSDKARLLVARAALGEPALLALNRIDAELDDDGRAMLRRLIENYPGVVLVSFARPEGPLLLRDGVGPVVWDLDELPCGLSGEGT